MQGGWDITRWLSVGDRRIYGLVCLVVLAFVLVGAAAARAEGPEAVCPEATEETAECMSFTVPEEPGFGGSGEKGGLDPENLHSAYKLPETGGSGQTIAIVDAYNNPDVESNLKTYRSHYELSECTTANGCFKKVNQKGETTNYPASESGWGTEISLDLDMVSAICPECHILLVEATTESFTNLEAAEDEAATLKATEISNSWGGPERSEETSENSAFEHPSIPITAAGGDYCYINECRGLSRPGFPAVDPSVITVGGTELKKAANARGWSESVWYEQLTGREIGTGSGCSLYESKPSWQTDKSCSKRTITDVSAVAACKSPLSVYDSYGQAGWILECGTSAAAPIIAGVEALSSSGARKEGPEALWKLGPKGDLFDITEGSNYSSVDGSCGSYLCEAKVGYDGPTGWGSPDGVLTSVPSVTTGSTTGLTENEATLHGTVNPEGAETKYYFEYGTTESYGSKTAEVNAGSGMNNIEVSKTITGLTSDTKYHYRIVATNNNGTTDGAGQTFTTTYWSRQAIADPKGTTETYLSGVSCPSSTLCIAVGHFSTSSEEYTFFKAQPLAEKWNGSEWSVQEPPLLKGSAPSDLLGVSCASATMCMAVGVHEISHDSYTYIAFAERWNGSEWSVQEPPLPAGAKSTYLTGVSCTSSTACLAVGSFENSSGKGVPLAEKWNGTAWSLQEPPAVKGNGGLGRVSCISSTECVAVGSFNTSTSSVDDAPLAEKWNGSEWSVQEPPAPAGVNSWIGTYLESVSCTSSTACTAVGDFYSTSDEFVAFTEKWNGSEWSLQTLPLPTGTDWSGLYDVSCASSTACTAVGSFESSSDGWAPLAEKWNGSEWSPQEPPSTEARQLNGVSCTTSTECTAVGVAENSSYAWISFAERYQ
jgi:hypothetical protein